MKFFLEQYKYHALLVISGMIWLSFLNFALQLPQQDFIFPDAFSYKSAAADLYQSGVFNTGRPVLINLINGFPLLLGFSTDAIMPWGISVNIICWFSTILLLFGLLKKSVNTKCAFIFTCIYITAVGSSIVNFHLLSESVFIFFLVSAVYFFEKYFYTRQFRFLSIALSVLLLSLLIKPAVSFLLVLVVAFFLFKKAYVFKSRWIVLPLLCLLLVFGHCYKMKQQHGNFTVSYIDGFTYYNYLGTRADCLKNGTQFIQCEGERFDYFSTFTLPEQKKIAFTDMKEQLFHNTTNLIWAYCTNLISNSCNGCIALFQYKKVDNAPWFQPFQVGLRVIAKAQNIFFTIIGILLLLKLLLQPKRYAKRLVVAAVFIVYVFLISGISSEQGDRFHIVFFPFVFMLAADFCRSEFPKLSMK